MRPSSLLTAAGAASALLVAVVLQQPSASEATFVIGGLTTQAAVAIAGLSALAIVKSKLLFAHLYNSRNRGGGYRGNRRGRRYRGGYRRGRRSADEDGNVVDYNGVEGDLYAEEDTPESDALQIGSLFDAAASNDGTDCAKKLVCLISAKDPSQRTPAEAIVAGLFDDADFSASEASSLGYSQFHLAALTGRVIGRPDVCERRYAACHINASDLETLLESI